VGAIASAEILPVFRVGCWVDVRKPSNFMNY
jgi:hypothetical protein